MLDVLKNIFDTFSAAIFVPIMLFIVSKALKIKTGKAFSAALYAGVGLTGFTLILNSYTPIISKVVKKMISNTGINLPAFDVGWQATSIVAYATKIGMIYIVIALVLQTALFFLKLTDTFQPSDLWNNYSYMVWGSMTYLITHSMILGLGIMILLNLYGLLLTDVLARRWSTYYKYPRSTIIALHNIEPAIFGMIMDPIWNKLGLHKVKLNPQTLQKKLGFLGEPISLGLFLGLFLGILGNLKSLGTLSAWGEITNVGIATSAVMAIFPKIAGIFAQAFAPISQAASKQARKSNQGEREWYLAVNDATGYGEPATLISGILLIPIMVLMAMVLPGNQTLPIVDLLALPYMVQGLIALSNGNIAKTVLNGTIWFSIGLYMCTYTAQSFTTVAGQVGITLPAGALLITSFNILGKPIWGLIFLAFISQNPIFIGLTVVVYLILYIGWYRNKNKVRDYLDKQAEKNSLEVESK
ncbi:PTS galactitol transporter subunit IIC [Ligilactobacillus salivarius]|uniref:PTS transporter subunit IIC n=1 Tax=Ligilactobacillus salivarius TaxID=1624 RepID=A0AAW7N8S4_9LACO|nr:PTS transporter subunit IIC [Ligilactobacillus salivarius]ATP36408.1 PTS galactitol transporter subunit IIC [Ligilactobacillus salivarius]MDN4834330.1 PTS transporter subunit IIC [Ligilactobacillus salivarius]OQR02128.1 PTS galactitol transporter subunit IIC [Ligilactobacillus salivarius]